MISFACKTINFEDLVRCSFDFNKTEFKIFIFLLSKKEPLCVSTIADALSKDRTTVQKAMKQLLDKEIVFKHQVNLEGGGYSYLYKIKDKDYIKEKLLNIVNGWSKQVINYIDKW